jgi:hypothetical protein
MHIGLDIQNVTNLSPVLYHESDIQHSNKLQNLPRTLANIYVIHGSKVEV